MKTIKELASMGERVCVHLKDEKTAELFLRQAESEGFTFGDGVSPTARHWSDLYAIHQDGTLNYVGSVGHNHYGAGENNVVRVEYANMVE